MADKLEVMYYKMFVLLRRKLRRWASGISGICAAILPLGFCSIFVSIYFPQTFQIHSQLFLILTLCISVAIASYSLPLNVDKQWLCLSLVLFTLVWGKPIFFSYIHYDELGRQGVSLLPSTWLTPVNDHLQPLIFPIWWIQYNPLFNGMYAPISLFIYYSGLMLVTSAYSFAYKLQKDSFFLSPSLTAAFIAVPLHSPETWWWKGCGDAPIMSLAFLSSLLMLFVFCGDKLTTKNMTCAVMLTLVTIFSSSAITLPFLYTAPLIFLPKFRNRKFLLYQVTSGLLSVFYWVLKSNIVTKKLSDYNYSLGDLPGAFYGAFLQYSYGHHFLAILLIVIVIFGFLNIRKVKAGIVVLMLIGFFIFQMGVIQLWAARNLSLATASSLSGYHMLFPFFGLSVVVALSLNLFLQNFSISHNFSFRSLTFFTLAIGLIVFLNPPASGFIKDPGLVLRARSELISDLRSVKYELMPNLSFADSPVSGNLNFAPTHLLQDKNQRLQYGWHRIVSVENISRLYGIDINVSNHCSPNSKAYSKSVIDFMRKYWGHDFCQAYV